MKQTRFNNTNKLRLLSLLLVILTALSFVSCAKGETDSASTDTAASISAEATEPAATADTVCTATSDALPSEAGTAATEAADIITYSATKPAATAPSREEVLQNGSSDPGDIYDATGFVNVAEVIPDAETDIRYYSDYNFVGERINGYEEPLAILTKEAAAALMGAQEDLKEKGYRIKIYDAYRPQRAVNHFASWANDWSDTRMKSDFYPDLDKSVLFSYGYIAYQSGHSRGSTVDLSLVDADTGEDIDMGGTFDYFGTKSHPDYSGLTSEQYNNRMILREAMINNGFSPLSTEWWHFSLNGEPYPYTYFDFPVSAASLSGS